VPSARVCADGVTKGLPCLDDRQCPGSTCASPATVCLGGEFDRYTCIDDGDCPHGICAAPTPVPTRTPLVPDDRTRRPTQEPTLVPAGTDSVSQGAASSGGGGGGGCAVVPTQGSGYEWLLLLALIAARYGLRRP
jgi:hypothetical protein